MDVTHLRWLGLGGQTVKNLRRLACKFDLDQSERKSSQVNASARKPWSNGVASRGKLKTWVYLRLRLARALFTEVEVNSTWLITSELANQRARKALFTCVVYTNLSYWDVGDGNNSGTKSFSIRHFHSSLKSLAVLFFYCNVSFIHYIFSKLYLKQWEE